MTFKHQSHEKLEGLGYLPPFTNSKHLRDTEHGIKIEFLTTGDYPGDGKPKPVSFPDPRQVSSDVDGITYVNLPNLVELKLASGMTNAGRLKDLADVMELIKVRGLPIEFAEQLNSVRAGQVSGAVERPPTRTQIGDNPKPGDGIGDVARPSLPRRRPRGLVALVPGLGGVDANSLPRRRLIA